MRKLRNRFKGDEEREDQIFFGSFGYFTIFDKIHRSPLALVFPKTIEEVNLQEKSLVFRFKEWFISAINMEYPLW